VALGPSIDTIYVLCSAFGEVARIAMFEKDGGLQSLVQYKELEDAREAQQTLDGSTLPAHLVPHHPSRITLKVQPSDHMEVSVRRQTDRQRCGAHCKGTRQACM
jgi:hypothetical protein